MEERNIIQTILVKYKCPICHIGYMIATGLVRFPNDTPSENGINTHMFFEHHCDNCEYNEYFEKTYPYKEEQITKIPEPIVFRSCQTGKFYSGYDNSGRPVELHNSGKIDLDSSGRPIDLKS